MCFSRTPIVLYRNHSLGLDFQIAAVSNAQRLSPSVPLPSHTVLVTLSCCKRSDGRIGHVESSFRIAPVW